MFADALEAAYGAVAYIQATNTTGSVSTRLLCLKTRVEPIMKQTLPLLELSVAVLAAEVAKRIKTDHNIKLH